jgi:hypothetical protein
MRILEMFKTLLREELINMLLLDVRFSLAPKVKVH